MTDHRPTSISKQLAAGPHPRGSRLLTAVTTLLNTRKNRILLVAESSLHASQFKAFRQLFLDEFGKNGLESELAKVLNLDGDYSSNLSNTGVERAGTDYAGKEVPK